MPGENRKIYGQIVLYYFIAFFICFLDQISKFWIERVVFQGSSIPIINKVFHITLVYNTGTAFGMFREHPYLFIVIAAAAVILIIYFLTWKRRILNVLEKAALCFVLGGTCGNLIDRLRYGYVIDFIDFRIWPVFNLADSFITVGAVILIFSLIIKK